MMPIIKDSLYENILRDQLESLSYPIGKAYEELYLLLRRKKSLKKEIAQLRREAQ